MLIDSLHTIFNNLDLSWIDSSKDITKSNKFYELLSFFPNLKNIFEEAELKDEFEFDRTIRHIFRVFKIYFLLNSGEFVHDTLSPDSINKIRIKLKHQISLNKIAIPLILIYHDIGRFINKKDHSYASYLLISQNNLFEVFKLPENEKLLIIKVIQYHLLFATIYTGESTFYGIFSLLNDLKFTNLISKEKNYARFIDLLEIFTFIDILGYPYAKIYDHYLKYYAEINYKLKEILKYGLTLNIALKKAIEFSQDWIEWRIAGALRIFQFVETQPHLTEEFYFNKLKESIERVDNKFIDRLTWDDIKSKYLENSYKIQIKYGLPFLMILAFGTFERMGLKIQAKISYKLVLFWILLSREIELRSKDSINYLWNIYLIGMPHWSKVDKDFIEKLNDHMIEKIITKSSHELIEERKEYNLYLDLEKIID